MSIADNTPVIIGVGQFTERLEAADYQALSSVELAERACRQAFSDALSLKRLGPQVDVIATTRTFEDSAPTLAQPFGKSDNFPRSIARRLGIDPARAVWEQAGGDSPQRLVNEFFGQVASGQARMVLITGAENISTARGLAQAGKTAQWAESVEGAVENRGMGLKGMMSRHTMIHRLSGAPASYALLENARRGRLGLSRGAYARAMGELFAPFAAVASRNPNAAFEAPAYGVDELLEVTERNRMIADPYPQRLVARDQVNQAAAVVITSVGLARELGIPEAQWVYLHGHSSLKEQGLLDRGDLSQSPAARAACQAALDAAGLQVGEIQHFDFYSCFPVAVFNAACDGLGLKPDDPRGLTVTGGLPFFGGPGNNYSLHAVAEMVNKLRQSPGSLGLVGANGGVLSKYAVGIYSTTAREWQAVDNSPHQAQIDALPKPVLCREPEGAGRIETYTTVYAKGVPAYSIVIGRLDGSGARFIANTVDGDGETLEAMLELDPLGARIQVVSTPQGNRFAFSAKRLAQLLPKRPPSFRAAYQFCNVRREGHLLEVEINRPQASNSLHPQANEELGEVFDAYEADDELWVAIITGAGGQAFCAGADLKHAASGAPIYVPKSGFGGLTSRVLSKPVIAAVNGFAMGGGTEICLACDIVVADASATFALSEVRMGVIAGAGGVVRLPRQIPKKLATELILTGRKFSAEDAFRWGLVSRIVERGEAMSAARAIAAEILLASPTSVRLSIRAMRHAETFASEAEAIANPDHGITDDLLTSEDFFEGPKAFAQKRKPSWKNR